MHFYDQNKSIVRRFRLDADGIESSEERKLEMQIQTHALIRLLCAVLKVVLFHLDEVFPSDKIGIARDLSMIRKWLNTITNTQPHSVSFFSLFMCEFKTQSQQPRPMLE